ncbi:hypothetical protein [Hymenobacter sp. 5516J-16]|uniref:hypothetical protein n=1 Tax=Hymenobacter sp. 5516J-16 TaxID=2932253 RepID=UPI00293E7282|nr:hypothetical protein [Hymenobacter sp. 5516J-16]
MVGVTLLDVFRREEPAEGGPQRRLAQFHSPPFSGTWAVSYALEKLNLSLDYTGQVSSPMALPVFPNDFRPGRSPWFALQNVQATRKLREGLELYGGLKNIFNFLPRYALLRPFDPSIRMWASIIRRGTPLTPATTTLLFRAGGYSWGCATPCKPSVAGAA